MVKKLQIINGRKIRGIVGNGMEAHKFTDNVMFAAVVLKGFRESCEQFFFSSRQHVQNHGATITIGCNQVITSF